MAMVGIIQGCENKASVLNRLMRNSQDIEAVLSPYLGNESTARYKDMIEKNIQLGVDLATAAGNKDQAAFEAANKSLFENADSIVAFENATIPDLTIDDRSVMWHDHINLTKNEATLLAGRDYNASIDTFDLMEEQTNLMSDSLANGIVQSLPAGFQ
jgi:hypothetical protein